MGEGEGEGGLGEGEGVVDAMGVGEDVGETEWMSEV